LVIIASYVELESPEIADHQVATVLVDDQNHVVRIIRDRVLPIEPGLESEVDHSGDENSVVGNSVVEI
jgi:hypothetical protein